MDLEIKGKLIEIGEVQQGTSKAGKVWQKLEYVILTDDKYPEEIPFEVFGEDKVEQFIKYNVLNDMVTVKFNLKGWKWNEKRGCNLQSWRCSKDDAQTPQKEVAQAEGEDDLPF